MKSYGMIENHQNGTFDILIAWTTNLKAIGFSGGIGSMPLETEIGKRKKKWLSLLQPDDCLVRRDLYLIR